MKTYLNDKIEAGLEDTAFFFILFGRPDFYSFSHSDT